jgi:hypothetical protein
MIVQVIQIHPVTKCDRIIRTFDNSIDANAERDVLDRAGVDYRVVWDCK